MVELNRKQFAESEAEFTESLFRVGGTCVGFAKRHKRQIKLFDLQKRIVGVINRWGVLCSASVQKDGTVWYSFADIDQVGRYLKRMQWEEDLDRLTVSVAYANNERSLIFK